MLNQIMHAATQAINAARKAGVRVGQMAERTSALFYQSAKKISKIGYQNGILAIYQSTQFTMEASWMQQPEPITSKTWGRRVADVVFFPFATLPGWFLGFVVIPTVVHSYFSFLSFVAFPQDIVQADLLKRKIAIPQKINGSVYGLVGAILGLCVGSFTAVFILAVRVILHSGEITAATWTRLINGSVQDVTKENELVPKLYVNPYPFPETRFSLFLGIFPLGWLTSLVAGGLTLSVIISVRIVLNTFVSIINHVRNGLDLAESDMHPQYRTIKLKVNKDLRSIIQRILGSVGEISGLALGLVSFTLVGLVRVCINSGESFIRILFPAIQLALQGTPLRNLFNLREDRRDQAHYGFSKELGYPGKYLLGPVAALAGAFTGGILRLIRETIISGVNTGIESLNLVFRGIKNYTPIKPLSEQRKFYERVIGVIGYPLGLVLTLPFTSLVLLGRYLITNVDTARKVIRFFNQTSSFSDNTEVVEAYIVPNEGHQMTMPPIVDPTQSSHEPVSTEAPHNQFIAWVKEAFARDGRPVYIQILSLPGALLGTALGGSVRTLIETGANSLDSASRLINLALTGSKFKGFFEPIKPHRNMIETVLGSPGYFIGLGLATAPVITVGLIRWIITNGDSTRRAFVATINATSPSSEQLEALPEDQRPTLVRYSTFLGTGLGVFLGGSFLFGLNNIQSFERIFYSLSRRALLQSDYEDNIPVVTEDTRLLSQKLVGGPGIFFGGVLGLIGYSLVTFVRMIGNSLLTTYYTMRDMVDFVFLDEYPTVETFTESRRLAAYLNQNPSDDVETIMLNPPAEPIAVPVETASKTQRQDLRKTYPFFLGLPLGFILGGSLGLISAGLAGSIRIVSNSVITAYNTMIDFADMILPEKLVGTAYRFTDRKPIPQLLGLPIGKILGIVLGEMAWASIFAGRFAINTIVTAMLVSRVLAWAPPMSRRIPALNDPRKKASFAHQMGMLGYLFGIPFGIFGFTINYVLHTIYHSVVTAYRTTGYITFWSTGSIPSTFILGVEQSAFEQVIGKENRTTFERYGFGIVGIAIGIGLGAIITSLISTIRFITLNIRTFDVSFKRAANLTLEKGFDEASMRLTHPQNKIQIGKTFTLTNNQLNVASYFLGIAGVSLGGTIGTVVALANGIVRTIQESSKSYYHMSQSLLNVGLEAPYFQNGVAMDTRPTKFKALGGLGYLASTVTVGLVPATVLIGKGILVGTAVIVSPIVALAKLYAINTSPRFKKLQAEETESTAHTRMRELYSALKDGEFKPNQLILKSSSPASGGKGEWDFFRKAAIFNSNSLTEDILQEKLNAIRATPNGENHQITSEVKNKIKKDHYGFFFLDSRTRKLHDQVIDQAFEDTEKFVDDYLDGKDPTAPDVSTQPTAVELFSYSNKHG